MPRAIKYSLVLLSWLALLSLLSACQSFKARNGSDQLPLLPQNTWQGSIQVNQSLEINYEGHNWQGIAVLSMSADKLTMVHLSPLGQRLFTLTYENGKAAPETNADTLLAGQTIPAATIVSLLQLATWPVGALSPYYQGDWRLESDELNRQVFYQDERVVTVTRAGMMAKANSEPWPTSIHIQNAQIDMNIKTLDYKQL